VDVAFVIVGLHQLLLRVRPSALVEGIGRIDVAAANEVGRLLHHGRLVVFAERVESLDLVGGEATVPENLEVADLVARAFADGDVDQAFAASAIDYERVLDDPEIDVSAAGVELGDLLAQILSVLGVIELTAVREQESFGLGVHRRDDVLGGHLLVAVDADSRDGEAASFIDGEVDRKVAVGDRGLGLDACQVVALALVERIDAGDGLGDLSRIDRTAGGEGEFFLDVFGRDPRGADDLVVGESRTLLHLDHQRRLAGSADATEDLHILELTGRVERLDRRLDVLDAQGRPRRQRAVAAHGRAVEPGVPRYNYGFRRRAGSWRGLLRIRRSRAGRYERQCN